jgi:hypothetical protein
MPLTVNFPASCKSEHGHWSYSTKLLSIVIAAHNAAGDGTTADFRNILKAVLAARNDAVEVARIGAHWNPNIATHVNSGVISYPPGLNQNNEGSRGSFLMGLAHQLMLDGRGVDDVDMQATQNALNQAKQDAIDGVFWNPSLEDIVNG